MIIKFNNYIVESRMSIDELEILTPDQLGKLLHAEVKKEDPNIKYIKDLLYVGSPINFRDRSNWTALHHAVWHGYGGDRALVKLLVSAGADINARDTGGFTPWDYATLYKIQDRFPELNPNR